MKRFVSTSDIVARAERKTSARDFFSLFPSLWAGVRSQVSKIETRQSYEEPDNPSWLALEAGDWDKAVRLLPEVRVVDASLYGDLKARGVEFVRCRPCVFPASLYLRWEFEAYKINASFGERIFCCNRQALDSVFDKYILHDFVIFDSRFAVIHDYDEQGRIQGGWYVTNSDDVFALLAMFAFVKANCQPLDLFLAAQAR